MIRLFSLLLVLAVSFSSYGQTLTENANGTSTLSQGTTSYVIDSAKKFKVTLSSDYSNETQAGLKRNGIIAYRDAFIEVSVQMAALPSTPTGSAPYQVWRSSDILISYDAQKLEFVSWSSDHFMTDKSVIDVAKSGASEWIPGLVQVHAQCLKAPESRIPALRRQPFQWNFGGFIWREQNSRQLGRLKFKVKGDFYYPESLATHITAVAQAQLPDGSSVNSKIDGGISTGNNVIGPIQNDVNKIAFGPSPESKVNLTLKGPATPVKAGDDFAVQIITTPDSAPQVIWSVSSIFIWDSSKLALLGMDKTGAKASIFSKFMPGGLNESEVPQDGNAQHLFGAQLGDKRPIAGDTLIVTLRFKALQDFTDTKIELVSRSDPRLSGVSIIDECGVIGSVVAGKSVTGTLTSAVIRGVAAQP
jgi:hypothetical protein